MRRFSHTHSRRRDTKSQSTPACPATTATATATCTRHALHSSSPRTEQRCLCLRCGSNRATHTWSRLVRAPAQKPSRDDATSPARSQTRLLFAQASLCVCVRAREKTTATALRCYPQQQQQRHRGRPAKGPTDLRERSGSFCLCAPSGFPSDIAHSVLKHDSASHDRQHAR